MGDHYWQQAQLDQEEEEWEVVKPKKKTNKESGGGGGGGSGGGGRSSNFSAPNVSYRLRGRDDDDDALSGGMRMWLRCG